MPTPRIYDTPAERQAAYRPRHPHQQPARERDLALLARSLQAVFQSAVKAGASRLPPELLGHRSDETLQAIIQWLDHAPDPVRYGGPPAKKEDAATR